MNPRSSAVKNLTANFFFLLEHLYHGPTISGRCRSHLLLTIPEGMPFAQPSACLSFGRGEHYDLFTIVGPVADGREEIHVGSRCISGGLRYSSLRTTGPATNAA